MRLVLLLCVFFCSFFLREKVIGKNVKSFRFIGKKVFSKNENHFKVEVTRIKDKTAKSVRVQKH